MAATNVAAFFSRRKIPDHQIFAINTWIRGASS